jgi:hypothetical protein
LFAFKALQMCFLEPPPGLNLDFGLVGFMDKSDLAKDKQKRQQLANRLNPLINYILVPPYLASKAERDGYRFIRAEAIRALGQIALPFVPETPGVQDKKKGKVLAPVAYALMRVLVDGDDGLYPPPSLIEKVEAALGLCRINANAKVEEEGKNPSRYNDEISVVLVGDALVHFIKQYQNDPGASPLAKASAKIPPMLPWKIYSKLLLRGLDEFSKNLASAKAKQNLAKIVDNVKPDLEKIAAPGAWKDVGQPLGVMENLHSFTAPNPVVYQDTEYKITFPRWPLY